MKVRVYPEGYIERAREYALRPRQAAEAFAESGSGVPALNLCVEALDDEARELPGWHSDEDATHFRMFVATPTIAWAVVEVQTFNAGAPK